MCSLKESPSDIQQHLDTFGVVTAAGGGGRLLLTSSWRGKNATGHLGYRGQSAPTPSKVPSSAMAIVQQLEQSQSEGRGQVGRICRSRGED